MIGISPAYYLSLFSKKFTFSDMVSSLYQLEELEYNAMQIEVFYPEQLEEWTDTNCEKLKIASVESGIKLSQFVAHFLLDTFVSPETLSSEAGLAEIERISLFLKRFKLTDLVTIPLGVFRGVHTESVQSDFVQKLSRMKDILKKQGQRMAVEPMPGSLGSDLKILKSLPELGLNLDPGHILCSGLDPFNLDESVMNRVFATHLCDNNGRENTSDIPGTFHSREDWGMLLENLKNAGFQGSLDVEIICPAEEVVSRYRTGRIFLKSFE
ncbi:TIM barrel protein [Oceanispirochaeta sp.]|uniref:sugar phosphate isomerase/epimerase family protein n=1 Tax=Oceanispirochaeta sp. TaxID=2035350 RepID=UPI0026262954|nr:TIM barrel protein [Oceanispirochaeta sp.]MDA3956082.1 TIM barrel protein [Oceanispirochaeta sp.]